MKKRIVILIILAGLAAGGYYLYPRLMPAPAANGRLHISGNIEAHESVASFRVPGRIVELPVEEGQWVEAGAVLAKLDDTDYRQQVSLDEAAEHVREANLNLALAGTRKHDLAAAQQALADAEADLAQRRLDFQRAKTLQERDVVSAEQRDLAATALKRSETSVARAKERLEQLKEGTRAEEIAVARSSVEQARQGVELSRIRLGYTVLRAPKAGVVTVRQAELGEVVQAGTPVVTIAEIDRPWLRGYISETDLGRVRWGQEADVRTDTFPGKTYRGRISFISPKAEFTPKTVETFKERVTLVYRVKIDLENAGHELKPGMPADAVIATEAASQKKN